MAIQTAVLHNNIVLITEPIASVQTLAIGFWFPIGSRDETEQRGITHFTEHVLFKGTEHRSAYEIACEFDRFGGSVNAFTDREMLCIHCVVPSYHALSAIHLICDMIQHSLFLPCDVEKERDVIESEIISSLDDPEEAATDAVFEKIWRDKAFSQSIAGTVRDSALLDRDMLFSWYNEHIVQGPLLVSMAGHICEKNVYHIFEQLPHRKPYLVSPSYIQSENTNNEAKRLFVSGESHISASFQQSQLFVLYPLALPSCPEAYEVWVLLNALIGDTMSSRLFQKLREETGYCYNVYTFFQFFRDRGLFGAYASSSKRTMKKITLQLYTEFAHIHDKGFTQKEITYAVEHVCGSEMIACEDMENRMRRLVRLFVSGFKAESLEKSFEHIRAISPEYINISFNKIYEEGFFAQVLYG